MPLKEAVDSAVELLDRLGLLERVKLKLVNDPDPAGAKLGVVLSELAKSYQALDDALARLSALSFIDDADVKESRDFLNAIVGGRVGADVASARGHCHVIANIYERYLRGWFSRVLDASEANEMDRLFFDLSDSDTRFLLAMSELTDQLPDLAAELLDQVDNDRIGDATSRVRALSRDLRDSRRSLSKGMAELWKLQADFTALSGAV